MGTTIIAFTAVILYGAGTLLQALRIRSDNQRAGWLAQFTGVLAVAAHLSFALRFMVLEGGVNLSVLVAGTAIAALLAALVLILSLRYPMQPLLLIAYPIALLSILVKLAFYTGPRIIDGSNLGVLLHVSLAITAFSLLALAAIQAVLLYFQHHHLKAHHNGFLVRALPPLETMEALLFGLIHTGVAILTLAIITGAIFVQDLFSQQLAHKTVFTLLAWLVFAALILGHQIRGWRGAVASRWTLAGCILLALGYFGSRLVIDVIL
ncbi:cytochrome C assembly family protein [Vreelandella utahensis]|uniref:cytochrome C assembly family protein n=1 Tax=Vreelandella halophila TaxID=86177 RepID=UPI0009864028|nr:cytochrome c biogenesis protein CcsA [Halomonas utahensis]